MSDRKPIAIMTRTSRGYFYCPDSPLWGGELRGAHRLLGCCMPPTRKQKPIWPEDEEKEARG